MQGENRNTDPNEERSNHISDLFTGARLAYDKPDLHFVGTGEGAQVYGWGHYSSASRGVAQDEYVRRYVRDYKAKMRLLSSRKDEVVISIGGKRYREANYLLSDNLEVEHGVYHALNKYVRTKDGSVTRDANGDYIVTNKDTFKLAPISTTYNKDLFLFAAADSVLGVHPVELFGKDSWIFDYRFSDEFYESAKTKLQNLVDNPVEGKEEQTFFSAELLNGPFKSKEEWHAFLKKISKRVEIPKPNLSLPAVMEQTWWMHRPAGDESHLLNWFEKISDENLNRVAMAAKDAGATQEEIEVLERSVYTGGGAYEWLGRFFEKKNGLAKGEAKKAASEALYAHDIDGVKYPVGAFHNPRNQDGRKGWNYVAFSDEFLRVDHVYEWNPKTDDFEKKWHETRGAGSRFTETPLGQELVAKAFDVIVGSRVDLLLRPSRYYGNPYETRDRNPRNALVTEHLHRDVDVSEPKGFATEVSAEISRFGTREGDPTLREIRERCGSKARFYEVLGAVYETAEAVRSGLSEVVTGRERTMMSNAGLQAADFIKHNATARATALGRKLQMSHSSEVGSGAGAAGLKYSWGSVARTCTPSVSGWMRMALTGRTGQGYSQLPHPTHSSVVNIGTRCPSASGFMRRAPVGQCSAQAPQAFSVEKATQMEGSSTARPRRVRCLMARSRGVIAPVGQTSPQVVQ